MQWLKEHFLTASLGVLGVLGLLLALFRAGLAQSLARAIRALRETELKNALRDYDELKQTNAQLEHDLQQELRTNLAYRDINTQDRATIRTLVAKIDQHNAAHLSLKDDRLCLIDYSDVHEEVKNSLGL
jgi:hypothetical protein